jgi:hypothetical protein
MRRFLLTSAILLAAFSTLTCAGVVLDRIVATIDSAAILQSDWDRAVAFEALKQGRPAGSFNQQERRAALDRLVDQQLLRAQMGESHIADVEEKDVAKSIQDLRALYPQARSDEDWRGLIAGYGFDETTLREKVSSDLEVARFVNLRLRPESRVSRADIETYYNKTFVPEVEKRGGKPDSLATVSPKIEEILRQQRMELLLSTWLSDLRGHSEIQFLLGEQSNSEESTPPASSGGH